MAGYAVYIDKEAQSWQIAQSDHTLPGAVWRGHGCEVVFSPERS